jgi:hypothetical protein
MSLKMVLPLKLRDELENFVLTLGRGAIVGFCKTFLMATGAENWLNDLITYILNRYSIIDSPITYNIYF